MAYILGFSNKPFKDPPPPPRPPQPNALLHMVTTPGGVVEWTASDGRKGKLTGKLTGSGRQRLTEATLAKVPSEKQSIKGPRSKKKAATEQPGSDTGGGLMDLFAGAGNDKKSEKNDQGKGAETNGWSPQQDAKLMELKTENASLAWDAIAVEVGKSADQCKGRFKNIKPKDWKPNVAKKGGGRGKTKRDDNQNNAGSKDGQKNGKQNDAKKNNADTGWGGDGGNNSGSGNDNTGGNTTWNTGNTGGQVDTGWDNLNSFGNDAGAATGKQDNSGTAAASNTGPPGCDTTEGNTAGAGWDTLATHTAATDAWPTTTGENNNNFGCGGNWNNPSPAKSASKAPSKASKVKSSSHHHQKSPQTPLKHTSPKNANQNLITAPLELEVSPDNTFSADDLRLVARILQQDCSMVWDRVSWRFRDKTGRTLHPDLFERKITGHVEGKGSEMGGRRRK